MGWGSGWGWLWLPGAKIERAQRLRQVPGVLRDTRLIANGEGAAKFDADLFVGKDCRQGGKPGEPTQGGNGQKQLTGHAVAIASATPGVYSFLSAQAAQRFEPQKGESSGYDEVATNLEGKGGACELR